MMAENAPHHVFCHQSTAAWFAFNQQIQTFVIWLPELDLHLGSKLTVLFAVHGACSGLCKVEKNLLGTQDCPWTQE